MHPEKGDCQFTIMNHESQEQNKRLQCAEQNKPAAINKRDHQNTANFQDVNQRLKVWQGKGKKNQEDRHTKEIVYKLQTSLH